MPDTVKAEGPNRLSAFDPGLPFLATQAAIELDNLLLNKDVEGEMLSAVRDLAELLQNSTKQGVVPEERTSLMDPTTVSVFSNAIAACEHHPVRTMRELALSAWTISRELDTPNEEADVGRIERLRSFCNSLAHSAIARERSRFELQAGVRTRS